MSLIKAIKAQLGLSVTPANNDFYVYAHCKENGEPYYIGKGRRNRHSEVSRRSDLWRKHAEKYGVKHHIIAKNLTEEEAYAFEKKLVTALGKKCDGTGILANLVDGGFGVVGLKHTDETKAKLSAAHRGKVLSEDHRRKMSEAHKVTQNLPEVKSRLIEIRNTDSFKKQAAEKASTKWKDPAHRERMAEIKRQQWADPEYRANILAARRAANEKRRAA